MTYRGEGRRSLLKKRVVKPAAGSGGIREKKAELLRQKMAELLQQKMAGGTGA